MSFGRRILGEGPTPARILILGEAGGPEEHRSGRPFDDDRGRSGKLLTAYLAAAGIARADCYVDNRYPFWTGPGNPDPTPEQLDEGDDLLHLTLGKVNPKFVLCLGRVAAGYFYTKPFTMEEHHGRVLTLHARVPIFIAYHPAAGLHQPSLQHHCFRDIQNFAALASGRVPAADLMMPADFYPHPLYTRADGPLPRSDDHPAVDTEGFPHDPWLLSMSSRPGSGIVATAAEVRKWDPDTLSERTVLFANAMHDFAVLRAMGLRTDHITVRDTRIAAYLLCEAGQGLKELAYRECGMRMRSYEEVARPPSLEAVQLWLGKAMARLKKFSPAVEELVKEDGKMRLKKPHSLATRIKSLDTSLTKDPELDVWSRWDGFPPSYREEATKIVGPFPKLSLMNAPEAEWTDYSGRDPDATRRLYFRQVPRLTALGLQGAFELDCAAMPMFEEMQSNGMKLDLERLDSLRPPIVARLARRERDFSKKWLGGKAINLRSKDQVAEFVYGPLGCRVIKTTDTGARGSMDDAVLEMLRIDAVKNKNQRQIDCLGEYMEYAQETTNLSFIDRLPKWVQADGRLHPTILITRTVTGRPATKDPQLLNIPIRTEEGRRIREAFVSEPGFNLLSIDLSQIELRVFAHLSQDKRMMQAFHDGEDLHQMVADEVKITRSESKTVNFLILYGGGAYKLSTTLALAGNPRPEDECEDIIQRWYSRFSGARGFIKQMHLNARKDGYVRTLAGRIRFLPNARLPAGDYLREEAERFAQNTPIQGGAADIIKMAMVKIWKWIIANREERVRPLLQIYDDLIFEIPEGSEEIGVLFKSMMTRGYGLKVPLDATVKLGKRWGEMEK